MAMSQTALSFLSFFSIIGFRGQFPKLPVRYPKSDSGSSLFVGRDTLPRTFALAFLALRGGVALLDMGATKEAANILDHKNQGWQRKQHHKA